MNLFINGSKIKSLFIKHVTSTLTNIGLKSPGQMNFSSEAAGKIMHKFLTSKKKRRHYFADVPMTSSRGQFGLPSNVRYNKENSRRIAVLNSLFMQHITDLLVNGDLAQDVLGKGLEISRVAMAPNFEQLNVFWATNKAEFTMQLEEALPQLGFTLRHKLTQLQVIGIVPRVVFVKDKNYNAALKVEYLLSIADYGDDHVAPETECDFKHSPSDASSNTSPTQDKSTNNEAEIMEETMPIMRHDTFNLDHNKIMNKITKNLHKAKSVHRYQPTLAVESEGFQSTMITTDDGNMSAEDRKEAIAKFILNRKILMEKKKENKHKSDSILKERQEEDKEVDVIEDFKTDDYFDDEEFVERNR